MWISKDHYNMLQAQIVELKAIIAGRDNKINDLTERLLFKERIPETPEKQNITNTKMLQEQLDSLDFFNDLDGGDTGDSLALLEQEQKKARNDIQEFAN